MSMTVRLSRWQRLFPGLAARRSRHLLALEQSEMTRKFAGAMKDRFTADWQTATESADAALNDSRETLVNRSRDLTANDPHAAAAIEQVVTATAGDRVRVQARAVGDDPAHLPPPALGRPLGVAEAEQANRDAERGWDEIVGSIDGHRQSFSELIELSVRQEIESGESLIHLGNRQRVGVGASRLTTVVTAIEPDRLFTPHDLLNDSTIRNGIQFDATGLPQTYFVAKEHPGDVGSLAFKRADFNAYDAADVLHSYQVLRPGQSRGRPWLTPAMIYLRHKQKSMDAEMVAQRFAACICAFIKTPQAASVAAGVAGKTNAGGERVQTLKPGKVWYLDPQQDVTIANPRAGEQWVPGMKLILQSIGAALNIPYVVLASDFENVNYSSFRAAIMQFQRFIAVRRWRQRTRVIGPIWSRYYDEAVLAGLVRAPNYQTRRRDFQKFRVQWSGTQWVDPWREVQADVLSVQSGLLPHEFILGKYGLDLEEVSSLLKKQQDLSATNGLPSILAANASKGKAAEETVNAGDQEDAGDEELDEDDRFVGAGAAAAMHNGNGNGHGRW